MGRELKGEHSHGSVSCTVSEPLASTKSKPTIRMTVDQAALLSVAIDGAATDVLRGDLRTAEAKQWVVELWVSPNSDGSGKAKLGVFTGTPYYLQPTNFTPYKAQSSLGISAASRLATCAVQHIV